MLRLTTLGAVGLTDAADPSAPHPVLGQPKRLALLAHLAVAYPGALARRDALLGLLWPEYDDSRARRALRQTLYHLRRQLGDAVLVGGGRSGVGVDPDRVWCDAVAFERAVAADRLGDALDLYGGELLPGLHAGSGEYDRWLDTARERLRRKAVAAATALVDRAEAAGDLRAAAGHAGWLLGVAPYDERAARTLMRLLAASGDRAGAVAAFDDLASRLEQHLELDPDPDTQALLEAVRAGRVGRPEAGDGPSTLAPEVEAGTAPADHALAVLPFSSLSGTAAERRFADGLTEMLITALARETSLSVISRTSVLRHRPGTLALSDMAQDLGVDRVVEGTVQLTGDRVRVTAQLLTTPPERHVWADSFERELDDPLAGQAELAGAMARSIERALDEGPPGLSASASAAARDAYFRGRCQFVRMTPAGFVEAARQFQEAIRRDPGFARAHASLAYAQAVLARSGRLPPSEAYAQARRRAEQALALDPDLAEAHTVLGTCAMLLDWDWPLAARHMQRGLRRGPDLPETYWAYSNLLCVTGHHQEARTAARRGRELDPVAPTLWLNEVLILVATGHRSDAEGAAERLAAFQPHSSASAFALGMVREVQGRHDAAAEAFGRAVELGGGPHSLAARAANLARVGRGDVARRILAELREADRYIPPTAVARVLAALGEADEAFRWLDRAAAVRDDWLLFMDGWPRFDGIRDDPRFAALRTRIGLPEPTARFRGRAWHGGKR